MTSVPQRQERYFLIVVVVVAALAVVAVGLVVGVAGFVVGVAGLVVAVAGFVVGVTVVAVVALVVAVAGLIVDVVVVFVVVLEPQAPSTPTQAISAALARTRKETGLLDMCSSWFAARPADGLPLPAGAEMRGCQPLDHLMRSGDLPGTVSCSGRTCSNHINSV